MSYAKPVPQLSERDLQRFISKIDFSSNCWNWKGKPSDRGYGRFSLRMIDRERLFPAHRVSYAVFISDKIPSDKVIDHICRNRICVNPSHLRITTRKDNILVGISPPALCYRRQSCSRGHEYNNKNSYYRKTSEGSNERVCRICHLIHVRKQRERLKSSLLN